MRYQMTASPADAEQMAAWLKVLAEPKRLHIIHLLLEGVQCNCELGDALDVPPNLVSHHLRVLREAGLVDMERDPARCPMGLLLSQPPCVVRVANRVRGVLRSGAHEAAPRVRAGGRGATGADQP